MGLDDDDSQPDWITLALVDGATRDVQQKKSLVLFVQWVLVVGRIAGINLSG